MKKAKLTDLRKTEETLRKSLAKVRDQINAVEDLKGLPALKKQYEGKFFKFMNSNGGGSDATHWPVYSFCRKIISRSYAAADVFESSPFDNRFSVGGERDYFLFQTEITAQEYMTALTEFRSKVILMGSNVMNEHL